MVKNTSLVMSKKPQLSKMVRDIFEEKKEVTLSELYSILSKDPDVIDYVQSNEIKHRIRSCIYSLSKSKNITRIAEATYRVAE